MQVPIFFKEVLKQLDFINEIHGSRDINLKGQNKLDYIMSKWGNNFEYLGDYKGRSIENEHYNQIMSAMKALKADSIVIYKLGFDGDYKLKQKIYPDYPEYTFYLYKYYGIKSNYEGLKIWEKNKL